MIFGRGTTLKSDMIVCVSVDSTLWMWPPNNHKPANWSITSFKNKRLLWKDLLCHPLIRSTTKITKIYHMEMAECFTQWMKGCKLVTKFSKE